MLEKCKKEEEEEEEQQQQQHVSSKIDMQMIARFASFESAKITTSALDYHFSRFWSGTLGSQAVADIHKSAASVVHDLGIRTENGYISLFINLIRKVENEDSVTVSFPLPAFKKH